MAETLESGQNAGAQDLTNQDASAGGTSTSFDVKALAEALKPYIAEEVSRAAQSQKDKRIGKMEGKVSDFEAQLARMKELVSEGWSEKQALRLMQSGIVGMTEPVDESELPQKSEKVNSQFATSVETTKVIELLGLDPNDPEVLRATLGTKDPLAGLIDVAAARKQKAAQQTNPAQLMGSGGGEQAKVDLQSRYREEVSKIARGDTDAQWKIIQKYRKMARDLKVEPPA